MKIAKNSVVALTYELVVDGVIVDSCKEEKPLEYIQGVGYLLPLFEANVEGKEVGDSFAFTLEAKDGYGEFDPNKVIDMPKEAFADPDGNIREDLMVVGSMITLVNGMGQPVPAKIVEVCQDVVKMDINHPMAGKTLNFSGKICSVREATEKEIKEGLHGEFVHSCNCGGGCSSGCEGGCGSDGEGCCGSENEGCCEGACDCK